ncbi:MAG: hypothetical protein E7018_02890 [Alphaproteobacteria bacterium]|nr:hypothetical protein [Alphaproteobacteria bacterium]
MSKDNQLRQLRRLEPLDVPKTHFDEYGRIIRENKPKKNKITYQVEDDAQIELMLDEQTKTCMVKCKDKTYPLFDEQNGMAEFVDSKGNLIYYDTQIPVKEGEEPIREEIDGKHIIKFGKNHEYTIPFESQNGEYYTQMKYEKGGTINIDFPGQTGFKNELNKLKRENNNVSTTMILERIKAMSQHK